VDAAREIALDGGRGIAVLEDVSRDDDKMDVVVERPINRPVQ